jgi:formimidoylglutamate deiminase
MSQAFFFDYALLPSGWSRNVRIETSGGVIAHVRADGTRGAADRHEALVIPGLSNVHSHAFQRAMAGLSERRSPSGQDDFWSWRELMYRFLARLGPEDIEAIANYAYADMLEAGFTSVGEFHYLHRTPQGTWYDNPAELAIRHLAAAEATGIGLTLLPVFYESSQFGGAPPTAGQRRFISDPDRFAAIVEQVHRMSMRADGARIGIAAHSLRAVTADHLFALVRQYPDRPMHIHAAEQLKEVRDCVAFCGQRPVEWLLRHVGLDARWCLVHATHVTAEETQGLARSGAVAGLCPLTEANLGDGIFPARAYLEAAGRWGIGTDSHISLDAAVELRQLEYSQRLTLLSRNVLTTAETPSTGRRLYEAALRGGAQALGQAVGAIAPGHRADFLVLDEAHPDLVGRSDDAILDTWQFVVGRGLIRGVIAGGQIVVEAHRHRARERINANYRRTLGRLMSGA